MKTQIKLKDKTGSIAFLDIEITHRNNYPELTISGEYIGGHGQVYDNIKPRTKLQKALLLLWETKHLKKVTKAEQVVIANLAADLRAEYNKERGKKHLSELDPDDALDLINETGNFSDPEKVLALALEEDITAKELDDIIEKGDNRFSYGGREYLVCTDEEADDLHDDELENYLDEIILVNLPAVAQKYFDREHWKGDAAIDGRGNSLNRYDGNEIERKINGTWYYLYRQ